MPVAHPRGLSLLSLGGLLVALALSLSACGGSSGTTAPEQAVTATSAPTATAGAIDITIKDKTVSPAGERIPAKVGQPVVLRITADAPGELHVHSTPEQHIEYAAGTSEVSLTLKQPGIVDVESHTLDKLILQLEVR